jgi:outer membrane protein OmpA-like peptidoglycan-associated protein
MSVSSLKTPSVVSLGALSLAAFILAGCTTTDPVTGEVVRDNTKTNALIGAAIGAGLGYATNTNKGSEGRKNAIIGAGIGALGGAAVGQYMDKQQAALRAKLAGTGVSVTRNGDNIILNMPSDVTFPTNGDQIAPQFYPVLNSVGEVLNQYPSTYVDVVGHADSVGTDDYNLSLSERRARATADYLYAQRVAKERLFIRGDGETRPVASNDTEDGRSKNRRVEVTLRPVT